MSRARHDHAVTHTSAVHPSAGGAGGPVAWLRPIVSADPGGGDQAAARSLLPLGPEDCLALAALLLEAARRPGGPAARALPEESANPPHATTRADGTAAGSDRRLGRALVEAGSRIAGLAAWLATWPPSAAADDDGRALERIASSLVLVDPAAADGVPRADALPPAAEVLRQAAAAAVDHLRLRDDFQAAVAEARLEAMRELAYGAGHEINNPLANIATRAQALLLEEADPERRRRLATIVDQSFRARDMIGGLMVFARPPKPRRGPADVGGLLAAVIESVRAQAASRGVRLEYSPAPTPRSAFVDRVQVEEAIRVVVLNAIEAVEPGGRVLLGVGGGTAGGTGGGGESTEITISDDGRGMSPEEARRAFDPFFSGREAGRGAGLGLPKAWRLIDSSGGSVVLESRPGQGTRATIALPATAAAAPAVAGAAG